MHKTIPLCLFMVVVAVAAHVGPVNSSDAAYSDIQKDEVVEFFRTAAWLDEKRDVWNIPIHGWIYEPQNSTARKALLEGVLKRKFDLAATKQTESNFARRLNLLLADNERGKQIVVAIGDRNYVLTPSKENGHFEATLIIPTAVVDKFADGALLRFSAVTKAGETRGFSGEALLLSPTGISVISDIDDTVKITNVREQKSLLEHTFLLDFLAVPGMAELYNDWFERDIGLHFVSSSPWQLYAPLQEFLNESCFPLATFSLKSIRFRDETLFDLFKKGTETKPAAIEKILTTYPGRRFVLVGDSGEEDPEVYAALLRKHPKQILRIYIRNATQDIDNKDRFQSAFNGIDEKRWRLFDDPQMLELPE